MSDLLRELRRHQRDYQSLVHGPLCGEAADEIEHMKEALRAIRLLSQNPADDNVAIINIYAVACKGLNGAVGGSGK